MEKHCHENLTKGPRNLGWELLLRGPTGGQVQGTWKTLACNHVSGETRLGGWPGEGRGLGRLSPPAQRLHVAGPTCPIFHVTVLHKTWCVKALKIRHWIQNRNPHTLMQGSLVRGDPRSMSVVGCENLHFSQASTVSLMLLVPL